jgi:hypothetical protein
MPPDHFPEMQGNKQGNEISGESKKSDVTLR